MKYIKPTINGIMFLEHDGNPNSSPTSGTITDNGDIILNSSICIDNTTLILYQYFISLNNGSKWKSVIAPVGAIGPQGIQGTQGVAGPQGIQGVAGPMANRILSGNVVPTTQGTNGDFYYMISNNNNNNNNITTAFLYGPKTVNGWESSISLNGPIGPPGPSGPLGQTGPQGQQGVAGPAAIVSASGKVTMTGTISNQVIIGTNEFQGVLNTIGNWNNIIESGVYFKRIQDDIGGTNFFNGYNNPQSDTFTKLEVFANLSGNGTTQEATRSTIKVHRSFNGVTWTNWNSIQNSIQNLVIEGLNAGITSSSILATMPLNSFPSAITIDSQGNIYTANAGFNNVSKITPGGTVITPFNLTSLGGTNPTAITIDSAGNIYTANSNSNSVSRINTQGTVTGTFNLLPLGTNPRAITIDSAGNIYTANAGSNNVSRINTQGTVTGTFNLLPLGTNPRAITIDSAGNIYTANAGSNNVSKITSAGFVTTPFNLTPIGISPQGITIDSAGNIYTANQGSHTVSKITSQGVVTTLGSTEIGSFPQGITIDSAGNIYTTNTSSDNVSRITPQGNSTILGTTGRFPQGITIDSAGNIYTANANTNAGPNNVTKITQKNPNRNLIIDDLGQIQLGDYVTSASGTYTPIVLLAINAINITPRICNFLKIGKVVYITGSLLATINSPSGEIRLSLPTRGQGCSGVAASDTNKAGIISQGLNIEGMAIIFGTSSTGTICFTCSYIIP